MRDETEERLAHLYTEGGEFIAIVSVPWTDQGFPLVMHYRGAAFMRYGPPDTDLYHALRDYDPLTAL